MYLIIEVYMANLSLFWICNTVESNFSEKDQNFWVTLYMSWNLVMMDRNVFSFDKGSMKYIDKRDETRKFLFYFNKHCHGLYVLSYILITRCIMKSC
jgi:hypothetical protein